MYRIDQAAQDAFNQSRPYQAGFFSALAALNHDFQDGNTKATHVRTVMKGAESADVEYHTGALDALKAAHHDMNKAERSTHDASAYMRHVDDLLHDEQGGSVLLDVVLDILQN